jgi:hypothetical protein
MRRTATGATMELREARIASRTKLHQEDCRKNPPKVFLVKRTKANSAPRRFREPAKAGSLFYGSVLSRSPVSPGARGHSARMVERKFWFALPGSRQTSSRS